MKRLNAVLIIMLLSAALFMQAPASAKTYEEYGFWSQGCLNGAASALTVLYFPVKLGYAVPSERLLPEPLIYSARDMPRPQRKRPPSPSAGGDWYITPRILLGEKKLHFNGCDDRGGTAMPAY